MKRRRARDYVNSGAHSPWLGPFLLVAAAIGFVVTQLLRKRKRT